MISTLVFIALLAAAHVLGLLFLRRRARYGLRAEGAFILWATTLGNRPLERLARLKFPWKAAGTASVAAVLILGAASLALVVARAAGSLLAPPPMSMSAGGVRTLLAIPGLNPAIPVVAGGVALLIAVLVHEAGHGIMAYANKFRLKSSGIIVLGLPVGAFVEPHEEDLAQASRSRKLRALAAGPAANLVLAAVAILLLHGVVLPAVAAPEAGVGILDVEAESVASMAGLERGDVITSLGVHPTPSVSEFARALEKEAPKGTFVVTYLRANVPGETTIHLASDESKVGITLADLRFQRGALAILRDPLRDGLGSLSPGSAASAPGSLTLYLTYPVAAFTFGDDVFQGEASTFLVTDGPRALLLWAATLLYWLIWVNATMAVFNSLPIQPLDGGQIARELLTRAPDPSGATRGAKAARVLGYATLAALVLPLLAARAWTFLP